MSKEINEYEIALAQARKYLEERKQILPHEHVTLEIWSGALADYQGLLADYRHNASIETETEATGKICMANPIGREEMRRSPSASIKWFSMADETGQGEGQQMQQEHRSLQQVQSDLGQLEDGVRTFLRADPHGPALPRPKIGGGNKVEG